MHQVMNWKLVPGVVLFLMLRTLAFPGHKAHLRQKSHDIDPFHRLQKEIIEKIIDKLGHDHQSATSLSMTDHSTWMNSKTAMARWKEFKSRIGNSPTFLPAVKQCFMFDDIACYKRVRKHFEMEHIVQPHHIAQLPALAAQLNAPESFKALMIDGSHEHWNSWMTRAAAWGYTNFLENVAQRESTITSREHGMLVKTKSCYFYSKNFDISKFTLIPTALAEIVFTDLRLTDRLVSSKDMNWVNLTMLNTPTHQLTIPNVYDIWRAMKIESVKERKTQLSLLKTRIKQTLEQGTYLIDDVMMSANNILKLWWKYSDRDDDDGYSSSFIQWLLDEGCPIEDKVLITRFPSLGSVDPARYERLMKFSVLYGYGSVKNSLVSALEMISSGRLFPQKNTLVAYTTVLHASKKDFPGLPQFMDFVIYLSKKDSWHYNPLVKEAHDQVMALLIQTGLSQQHLAMAREKLIDEDESKPRLLHVLDHITTYMIHHVNVSH